MQKAQSMLQPHWAATAPGALTDAVAAGGVQHGARSASTAEAPTGVQTPGIFAQALHQAFVDICGEKGAPAQLAASGYVTRAVKWSCFSLLAAQPRCLKVRRTTEGCRNQCPIQHSSLVAAAPA